MHEETAALMLESAVSTIVGAASALAFDRSVKLCSGCSLLVLLRTPVCVQIICSHYARISEGQSSLSFYVPYFAISHVQNVPNGLRRYVCEGSSECLSVEQGVVYCCDRRGRVCNGVQSHGDCHDALESLERMMLRMCDATQSEEQCSDRVCCFSNKIRSNSFEVTACDLKTLLPICDAETLCRFSRTDSFCCKFVVQEIGLQIWGLVRIDNMDLCRAQH